MKNWLNREAPEEKKLLVIDSFFAEELDLQEVAVLMPNLKQNVPWRLDKDTHEHAISAAVQVSNKLSRLFSERVYSPKLGYSIEACDHLFCLSGTLSVFAICDRLIRLNRLAKVVKIDTLVLPSVDFQFDTKMSMHQFMADAIESDPFFNQWLINQLLPGLQKTERIFAKLSTSQVKFKTGLFKKFSEIIKHRKLWEVILNRASLLFARTVFRISMGSKFFYKNTIPHNMNHFGESFIFGGFYWPTGPLINLPNKIPLFGEDSSQERSASRITRSDFTSLHNEIQLIFNEFLEEVEDHIYLPESTLKSISKILIDMHSELSIEHISLACDWAINRLRKFKNRSYISGAPAGDYAAILFTFAAKQLKKDVIGMQHSAWGGYLAYGPLVTELLIRGSDYYITFGWSIAEKKLSHWKVAPIPLPSPMLSYHANKVMHKAHSGLKKKHVLLALGFLYRFPSIPNSYLKIDYIHQWSDKLEEIIRAITAMGVEVTILMYNDKNAILHKDMIAKLIQAGNGLATLHSDHDFRVRKLIFSGKFHNHYDAVIWDIPAGGFSESLAMGVTTFALCDEGMISILPEGRWIIDSLKHSGIIFESGEDISNNILKLYTQSDSAFESSSRQDIFNFQRHFSKISTNWKVEWKNYLNSLR